MRNRNYMLYMLPFYLLLVLSLILGALFTNNAVTTIAENRGIIHRNTIIIDAGHGGVDGGATSCTGVLESHINLEISIRLNDLMHLLGIKTIMIRTTDDSVYTSGNSIAEKKVSDLRERVRIANSTENALLISIHQNYFSDEKYSGAQVFFADNEQSIALAKMLQNQLIMSLNPGSNRKSKASENIYLMQNVTCPAVLIECGFLSNLPEEALLRNKEYQQKLCIVIATTVSSFLANA